MSTEYAAHGGSEATAEVLDLSQDCTAAFRLQFDDASWQQYIDSLKVPAPIKKNPYTDG